MKQGVLFVYSIFESKVNETRCSTFIPLGAQQCCNIILINYLTYEGSAAKWLDIQGDLDWSVTRILRKKIIETVVKFVLRKHGFCTPPIAPHMQGCQEEIGPKVNEIVGGPYFSTEYGWGG